MTEVIIIWKPMDWFLYDNGIGHERVNRMKAQGAQSLRCRKALSKII